MRTVAIHQPQYLPYLGFFHKLLRADVFVLLDDVQFEKSGWQNRNRIKNCLGWQWLTVPVRHRSGQLINQVLVDSQIPWQRKHWNAISTNYSHAPYFDVYGPELQDLLFTSWSNLSEVNVTILDWLMNMLSIQTPILLSSSLRIEGRKNQRLLSICREVGADCYLSGSGAQDYLDPALFDASSITLILQNFRCPVYPQRFPSVGFVPNMSVVDALLNCGPDTTSLLQDWVSEAR